MTSPCYNCADRNAFCHSICERYKAYRDAKDRENEKRKKELDLFYALENAEVKRNTRFKRRR